MKALYRIVAFLIVISLFNCSAKYKNSEISTEERVKDLLKKMTLKEKIGQMTQVDRSYLNNPEDITSYNLGSIISGGNSGPKNKKPEEWARIINEYQSYAIKTRLGIPIIFGIDAVHGNAQTDGATIFPHNIGLGCTMDPELVKEASSVTAQEVAGTGIHWTFSPCIAVAQDIRWGRTYESFSENSNLVSIMGEASILGYQGQSLSWKDKILACAKHYAGDGGTINGKDQGDVIVDEKAFNDIHLKPYIDAIKAGTGSIMVSFSSWKGVKMHANKHLITDVLKDQLKFDGFVLTDWGAFKNVANNLKDQIKISVLAGIDMFMVPDNYKEFIETLNALVESKEVPIERIDDAVSRILKIKFRLGLFENYITDKNLTSLVGSDKNREVARKCVRKSVVLLKNDKKILPVSKEIKKILVAGKNADNLGYQCGGWTLSWQGLDGKITKGTTILDGIKQTVSSKTKIVFSIDGNVTGNTDLCILVIGEKPYAEFEGDSENLSLSEKDLDVLKKISSKGIPIIGVIISGRPLIITEQLKYFDGLIAAWLPGTEGLGVSDVLFGDYKPTGKLSFTWPKSMEQIPMHPEDKNYDPLFPYGFGLTY